VTRTEAGFLHACGDADFLRSCGITPIEAGWTPEPWRMHFADGTSIELRDVRFTLKPSPLAELPTIAARLWATKTTAVQQFKSGENWGDLK